MQRPEYYGRETVATPWAWTDAISSWSWGVPEGSTVRVEVYSDADEVELVAIADSGGREQARTQLRSATGPVRLGVRADRSQIRADDSDLAFVDITLEDHNGTVATQLDRPVTVQVRGAGILQGLSSGRGKTEERFDAATHTTFDGRALAIIRPTEHGAIQMTVSADGCEDVTTTIDAHAVT